MQLPLEYQGRAVHGMAPERPHEIRGPFHAGQAERREHRLVRERAEGSGAELAQRTVARPGQILVRERGPAVRFDVRARHEPASQERQLSIPVVPPEGLRGGRRQEVAARHLPARRFGQGDRSEEAVLIRDPRSGIQGTGVPVHHARPAMSRASQMVDR